MVLHQAFCSVKGSRKAPIFMMQRGRLELQEALSGHKVERGWNNTLSSTVNIVPYFTAMSFE